MSGLKIGHTSVVFAAAIIVASCVTIVDGAESLPRGRARLNDAHTTFVADNGALLRGCVASHKRESLEQLKLVGLNAVHDYAEGCDLKYPAEGSRAPGYRVEAIDKAVKLTKELGLYRNRFQAKSNCILFYFVFLGPRLQHMDIPRIGVELEQQLPAYATAPATQDP